MSPVSQHNPLDFTSRFSYSAGSTNVSFTSLLGGDTIAAVMYAPADGTRIIEINQVDVCVVTNANLGISSVRLVPITAVTTPSGGTVLPVAKALSSDPAPTMIVRTLPATTTLGTGIFGVQAFLLGVIGGKTVSENLINQPLYTSDTRRQRRPITLRPGSLEGVALVVNTAVISSQQWTMHVAWNETLA